MAEDTLVRWARRNKKLRVRKHSCWSISEPRDAADRSIKVAGQVMEERSELKLMGVTPDRTVTLGPHCRTCADEAPAQGATLKCPVANPILVSFLTFKDSF